jgi:hypothetical protein
MNSISLECCCSIAIRVSSYLELFAISRFWNVVRRANSRAGRLGIGPLFDLSIPPCQNRQNADEAIRDHHNARAAGVTTTPDRLALDPVTIRVLQPGKEGLGVEAARAIDTEIDLPQNGADR